jgi:hypothetical protein
MVIVCGAAAVSRCATVPVPNREHAGLLPTATEHKGSRVAARAGRKRSHAVYAQTGMAGDDPNTLQTPLERRVYVVDKPSAECKGEPLLATLQCDDGPVKDAIRGKIKDLLEGKVEGETVVFIVEDGTDTSLAVAGVFLDGDPRKDTFPLKSTKGLAGNPYVDLIARDTRHAKRPLRDGKTPLGTAALQGVLEVVVRERPALPPVWAFVEHKNKRAEEAFKRSGFRTRDPKAPPGDDGKRQLILMRKGGQPPPTAPAADAYRPVLTLLGMT